MLPPLDVQTTEDADLERAQSNIKKFVQPLEENLTLSGTYLEDVILSSGVTTPIEHKLDRVPRGWILCDVTGDLAQIARTEWDDKTITFNCLSVGAADVTVKLWVF